MKYKIGEVLDNGFIYVGETLDRSTGEIYGIAVSPLDMGPMSWHEACQLSIQTTVEGHLISANLNHLFNDGKYYWSLTDCKDYAWAQKFATCAQRTEDKTSLCLVRHVQRLKGDL